TPLVFIEQKAYFISKRLRIFCSLPIASLDEIMTPPVNKYINNGNMVFIFFLFIYMTDEFSNFPWLN
ncbi:hypothetical protein EWR26_24970, partial [Escherichia coli]|nr:hypothetical protein [Escherichia coli]